MLFRFFMCSLLGLQCDAGRLHHPMLSLERMAVLLAPYNTSLEDIHVLVENVNSYEYCINKIMAAKRWARNRAKRASEKWDPVLFVEAMCITKEYEIENVFAQLLDYGPLHAAALADLRERFVEKYVEFGSDAMYAFTWFVVEYMRQLRYDEGRLAKMRAALTVVRARYADNSFAKENLHTAYKMLKWRDLYRRTPDDLDDTGAAIFKDTLIQMHRIWWSSGWHSG